MNAEINRRIAEGMHAHAEVQSLLLAPSPARLAAATGQAHGAHEFNKQEFIL
jgi:hypothetical protein